jgi:hypothetical protein
MIPVVSELAALCVLQLTGKGCPEDQGVWPIVKTCLRKIVGTSVLNGEDRPSIIVTIFLVIFSQPSDVSSSASLTATTRQ